MEKKLTRAEEAALRAYPNEMVTTCARGNKFRAGPLLRRGFQEGYEQAEKDFVLTWEDMAKIDAIILDVNNEFAVDYSKEIDRKKFYEEVLRRFNEIKYGHEKDTK